MYPILFQIGPVTIYTYGFFVATGLMLGISLALIQAKKEGYDSQKILDGVFYIILAGIIGSRIFYVIQNLASYKDSPLNVFKLWEGGLVFYGGFLLGIPVAWILIRRQGFSFLDFFDLFAPSMAIGQAVGRIGCFFAGCCYGLPTQLPWGVTFTHPQSLALKGIPLHPTQLYSSLACFIIFFILVSFRKHIRFTGQLFCLYLILHSGSRFTIEFFRGDPRPWFWNQTISLPQLISLFIFITAAFLYFYCKKTHQSANQ